MQPIYFFFFPLNVRQTGVQLKERLATTCFEWLPPSHSDTETGRIEQPISHRGDTAANEKNLLDIAVAKCMLCASMIH